MKAILKTILAIFILSAIVGLIGCNTTKLGSSEIVVFRDVTDKHLAQPEISEIMSLINVSDNAIWNGATFRFSNLSDVSYTPVSSVKILACAPSISQIKSINTASSAPKLDANATCGAYDSKAHLIISLADFDSISSDIEFNWSKDGLERLTWSELNRSI